ncbi:hypothetical protein K488DRAFT_76361 [Vararia minispora EC-137]|uniref:Uncharacterized protein n=1 Tax=Vararia minispora EC-137 TaxID=1314806 RepID=A0ACB8QVX4_9AGAM|nr:hypothetical protein K488DRAFT_76361 [Vararia minispora EC-137]
MAVRSIFPRSNVLVLAYNSVHTLLPTTLIDLAESFLSAHQVDAVVALADEQRKKLQAKLAVDEDEADELRYVYQRIGFQCMAETRFEDAGYHLFEGALDPRLLISYFPDLRGALISPDDELDVFSGVAEHMVPFDSIDDIICADLVRNYSPYLTPNTRSAPPTAELRRVLGIAAHDMLETFLRKWRRVRREGSPHDICMIVDTVLAKLFAQNEKTTDLYALLGESPDVILSELEPIFITTGQYNALCSIYQARGLDEKLLEAWAKIADGEWTDPEIPDPISSMVALLVARRNRALTQQWGVWLTAKDPERALKLLTTQGGRRKVSADADLATLQQIRATNPEAGAKFLEYLVLQKHSTDPALHTELASSCISTVLTSLEDDATAKLWRAKAASYASAPNPTPFLSYFASTTPDSDHKRARLRAAFFLQGSVYYDVQVVREKVLPHAKALSLEMAILEGRVANDRAALEILANTLRDATSSGTYCTTPRRVLHPRAAQALADRYELGAWTVASAAASVSLAVDGEEARDLLRMLLAVYVEGGREEAAADLLSAQAENFDIVEALEIVPAQWSLATLSVFLTRSFRRTLHARHEAMIIKGVSMGQNLTFSDEAYTILREQGAIIEEPLFDDEDDGAIVDEKALPPEPEPALDEKIGVTVNTHGARLDETKNDDVAGSYESRLSDEGDPDLR